MCGLLTARGSGTSTHNLERTNAMPATMQAVTGPDGHLSNLRPFTGSSMSAQWTPEGCYIVSSYGTPIAWHANGETFHNTHRYSNTTSKHQSACREWLNHRNSEVDRRQSPAAADLAFRSTVLAELTELAS